MKEILDFCSLTLGKKKLTAFDLFLVESDSLKLECKDQKLDTFSKSKDVGISIRVLNNHRMGFSYSFDLSHAALERAIDLAISVSELMPKDESTLLSKVSKNYSLQNKLSALCDFKGLDTSFEEKKAWLFELERTTKEQDPRIKRFRKTALSQGYGRVFLRDETGGTAFFEKTSFYASVLCIAEENSDAQTGSEMSYSSHWKNLDLYSVAKGAAESACELLGAKTITSRKCPVVLKNSVVSDLIGFISDSFSADSIEKKTSLLENKLGASLFSKKLSLFDDPTTLDGAGSSPFDGEGTAHEKLVLIEDGVVKNFIYDRSTALRKGTHSTGHSARGGIKSQPAISTTNLILAPGQTSFDNLLEKTQNGILITDLLGLHTANPITGDFSVGASGILIENGRLTTPVKGFAVAGNIVSLLNDVEEVGSDVKSWGSISVPSLLVSSLAVSGG